MVKQKTQTPEYWVDTFQMEPDDIDYLYQVLLERETPLSLDEMALVLVRHRVQQDEAQPKKKSPTGIVYRPADQYQVGEQLVFPAMDSVTGIITDIRAGENPDYGEYQVISVEFEDGETAEFASGLTVNHVLNDQEPDIVEDETQLKTPEELFIEYGGEVALTLEENLLQHDDLVRLAGRWFPRSLLVDINVGHLNLAEAILDLSGGGPMTTNELIEQIGLLDDDNPRLVEFSMNFGLQEDDRFDEVGAAGQILWFLTRLEPPEVLNTPRRLTYTPVPYNPDVLTPELREIEEEIGDEHSDIPVPRGHYPDSITLTLTYPHHRAGTLPLSPQLRSLFPTAYEAPRIRFTLIDDETGEEFPAWVVRKAGYVYGLAEWLERHAIPVGTYLTIKRTEDPGRVALTYGRHRPRVEWVLTALVDGENLKFDNLRRPVGTEFDDLMIIDVLDPEAVDTVWQLHTRRETPLENLMVDLFRKLAPLTPQGHVHVKTLYSVVNVLRRCPPGPIFAALVTSPQFEHVGGPYWHLKEA